MKLPLYQIDAFADGPFQGNPAAVVILDAPLDERLMQAIAAENNLAETAFSYILPPSEGGGVALRWFTPQLEVPLCGHATLATAHVRFHHLNHPDPAIVFHTKSGPLTVTREDDRLLAMDSPAIHGAKRLVPDDLAQALGARPSALIQGSLNGTTEGVTMLAVFDDPALIAPMTPDFARLAAVCRPLGNNGVAVTARYQGPEGWDFVSRYFAPAKGIDEDPVTGGAHCALTPYWAARLGKTALVGRQLSRRGGTVQCELRGDRVVLKGRCADYLVGEITVQAS